MRALVILLFSLSLFSSSLMAAEAKNDPYFSFKKQVNLKSGPAMIKFEMFKKFEKKHRVDICADTDVNIQYFTLPKNGEMCVGSYRKEQIFASTLCTDEAGFYSELRVDGSCRLGEPQRVDVTKISEISLPNFVKVVDATKPVKCFKRKVKYLRTFLSSKPELENWFKKVDIDFTMYLEDDDSMPANSIRMDEDKVSFLIVYDKSKKGSASCVDIDYQPLEDKYMEILDTIEQERIANIKEGKRDSIISNVNNVMNELFNMVDDTNNAPKLNDNPAVVADSETQKDGSQTGSRKAKKSTSKAIKG